jgi:hypothetical protein
MSDSLKPRHLALAAGLMGATAIAASAYFLRPPAPVAPAPEPRPVHLTELVGMKYPLARTVQALAAPDMAAPVITRVRQGSELQVVGLVDGGSWYQVELPDKQIAYVQVDDLPAAAAPPAPAPGAPPPDASPVLPAPPPMPVGAAATPAIEFDEAHDIVRVLTPSAVYVRPDSLAPQAYPVNAGTQVYVIARSRDGQWAWVNTADAAAAYMPLANLGP